MFEVWVIIELSIMTRQGVKTMDKNIKAELVALKHEIVTNLKNIEGLVTNIDNKIQEEDEIACLAKCSRLTELLDRCSRIKWAPDADTREVTGLTTCVSAISKLMSTTHADRYLASAAAVIKMSRQMDALGTSAPPAAETMWETISPGIGESIKEFINHHDGVKPVPVQVDHNNITDMLIRMNHAINKTEPVIDPAIAASAPAWAKDSDTKTTMQILKEASEWDADAQLLFGRMWNQTAKRRIELLEEGFNEVIELINGYNYYNEQLTIKNRADATALVERYAALDHAKVAVIELLTNFDRVTLNSIATATDDLENFVRYYEWYGRLFKAMEDLANENAQCAQVARSCFRIIDMYIKPKEMQLFDLTIIDASSNTKSTGTIEFMKIPHNKQEAFRTLGYNNYIKDLTRAYAWINQRDAVAE